MLYATALHLDTYDFFVTETSLDMTALISKGSQP